MEPTSLETTSQAFQCQVCFDVLDVTDSVTLTACSHRCCRACLREYVTGKITSGQLAPKCYHLVSRSGQRSQLCSGVLSVSEIESLIDEKTVKMYRRFQFNQLHPIFGRQCPHCDHSQVFANGEREPDCTCERCGTPFCFTHGNAHTGRTCTEYEDTVTQVERVTIAAIERMTKRCPGCAVTIEKDGGCNHMTCLKCGASFCWLCLSYIESTAYPEHFQAMSFSGCGGLQEADSGRVSWTQRIEWLATRGLIGVFVIVPAALLTSVLTVLTFGWYPLRTMYGTSVWANTKTCFHFTSLSLFSWLDNTRRSALEWLRESLTRSPT